MIKLKNILKENAGYVNDPSKPKKLQKIEDKLNKFMDNWKQSYAAMNRSPKLQKLRHQWDSELEKSGWNAKYNFGDLLA